MSNYSNYLLAIILIIAAIALCLVFFLHSSKRKAVGQVKPISCGNVSVFFDRTGNVTIIPHVKDKFGQGKATTDAAFLMMPYTPAKLGSFIRASMEGCKDASPCTNRELLEVLGTRDWVGFTADKRNISIHYKENYGIIFNTTRRKTDGTYEFNYNGMERTLQPDTSDVVLGNTALELLPKCR